MSAGQTTNPAARGFDKELAKMEALGEAVKTGAVLDMMRPCASTCLHSQNETAAIPPLEIKIYLESFAENYLDLCHSEFTSFTEAEEVWSPRTAGVESESLGIAPGRSFLSITFPKNCIPRNSFPSDNFLVQAFQAPISGPGESRRYSPATNFPPPDTAPVPSPDRSVAATPRSPAGLFRPAQSADLHKRCTPRACRAPAATRFWSGWCQSPPAHSAPPPATPDDAPRKTPS